MKALPSRSGQPFVKLGPCGSFARVAVPNRRRWVRPICERIGMNGRGRMPSTTLVNSTREWDQREFFRSGEIHVANEVMPEMHRICGGLRSPLDLSILEIGCGIGRMTKMLARVLGRVTAIDVSKEMIDRARVNLHDPGMFRCFWAMARRCCISQQHSRRCLFLCRVSTHRQHGSDHLVLS